MTIPAADFVYESPKMPGSPGRCHGSLQGLCADARMAEAPFIPSDIAVFLREAEMSRRIRWSYGLALATAFAAIAHQVPRALRAQDRPSSSYAPTSQYDVQKIQGWTVLVNKDFLKRQGELADRVLTLLRYNLLEVERRVPAPAVGKLRKIRIWIEEQQESEVPLCMCYHPDEQAVRNIGKNPDKARCVEIANARRFLAWSLEQPSQILHELAHGYHHQFLAGGFENREIKAVYDRAMRAKLYQSVLRMNGKKDTGYAASNPAEYFAEATEAFFGVNDYYPFVYPELLNHDPTAARLLEKVWGGKTPHPVEYLQRSDR
jgi:hypothetical protein